MKKQEIQLKQSAEKISVISTTKPALTDQTVGHKQVPDEQPELDLF